MYGVTHLAVTHHEAERLSAMSIHKPRRLRHHAYAPGAASAQHARAHRRPVYDPGPHPLQALAPPSQSPQRRALRWNHPRVEGVRKQLVQSAFGAVLV
jgi:hypothetical protein